MAIRGDSFSSVADVLALTRHLLDGESTFNYVTRPTVTEVEGFIDEMSADINTALWDCGFDPTNIRANSTAKLVFDRFVRTKAAEYVELTQRGAGYADVENTRIGFMGAATMAAKELVEMKVRSFKRMGITVSDPSYQGLAFTAEKLKSDRADPDNTSLEQPKFNKGQFDNA